MKQPTGNCGSYDVKLKVDYNGFQSDDLFIDIGQPKSLQLWQTTQLTPFLFPEQGWWTNIDYKVLNRCGDQMTNIAANEVFTDWAAVWAQLTGGWPLPLHADGFNNLTYDAPSNSWLLRDKLWESGDVSLPVGQQKSPMSLTTGANGYSETAGDLVTRHVQQFRVGFPDNGGDAYVPGGPVAGNAATAKGILVQTNDHYHYLDHGAHKNVISPPNQ
jgi:hypothetical protein